MPMICQSHTKVDSIIISILDNKYLLLARLQAGYFGRREKGNGFPFSVSLEKLQKEKSLRTVAASRDL